jgi:hypothetical protein
MYVYIHVKENKERKIFTGESMEKKTSRSQNATKNWEEMACC